MYVPHLNFRRRLNASSKVRDDPRCCCLTFIKLKLGQLDVSGFCDSMFEPDPHGSRNVFIAAVTIVLLCIEPLDDLNLSRMTGGNGTPSTRVNTCCAGVNPVVDKREK